MQGALTRDDARISEWLFLLTIVVCAYFYSGAGWSQNSQFDLTRAIVERHTFAIDAYARNSGDLSFANGHVYSNKAPALSFFAAIPYALLYALLGVPQNALVLAIAAYVCTLMTVGALAALVPAILYRGARRRGVDPVWAVVVALTTALATEALPYSTLLMFMLPSGVLMLIGWTARRDGASGFWSAIAVATNYLCAPALAIICIARIWRAAGERKEERERGDGIAAPHEGESAQRGHASAFLLRAGLRFGAGAFFPLAALALYQRVCFGAFFATSISRENPAFHTRGAVLGVLRAPSLEALYGITISPYRGLFFFAPVLLLALVPLVRERAILSISIVFFAVNASFNGWEGGFAVGARYLVPLIPLWGLALLEARPRWLVVALAVVSFAINFAVTAVDPQPSGTIPRPLTQYIVPLLIHGRFGADVPITRPWSAATFTGHTSVNRMAHDEAVVFSRHAPGSEVSEWSSFNLGEAFFGPGDARSLIPILLLVSVGVAAIVAKARRVQQE